MQRIRVHISVMFAAARAAGLDRVFGTPRNRLGGFERAVLASAGAPDTDFAVLPVRGERWPAAVRMRCEQITQDTYHRHVRHNTRNQRPA